MSTIAQENKAEDYVSQPPAFDVKRRSKDGRDSKDILVMRLKSVNFKLREHLKDLNYKLELAIDKSQTVKKPKLPVRKVNQEEESQKIRDNIERIKKEIDKSQTTFDREEAEQKLQESISKTAELK